jgi:hypothetical protein
MRNYKPLSGTMKVTGSFDVEVEESTVTMSEKKKGTK